MPMHNADKMIGPDSYGINIQKPIGPFPQAVRSEPKPSDRHPVFRCFSRGAVDVISRFSAELIGTALLMFVGCGSGLSWSTPRGDYIGAIGFGLTVLMIIQCFGTISGAHLNPAVTVCAVLYRLMGVRMAAAYFAAQLIGAFVGYGLLAVLTPVEIFAPATATAGHCMTVPHASLSATQALSMEFLSTMVLITLCCASWDPRNATQQDSVALKFGLSVAVLSIAIGPSTGCSMNPARTLGPAIWNNEWTMHWIYWVGPMAASVFTTLLYQSIFAEPRVQDDDAQRSKARTADNTATTTNTSLSS